MAGRRGPSESRHKGETLAALRTAFDLLVRLQQGGWELDGGQGVGEGVTVEMLAAEQGLTTRQIGRYLEVLEDFGVAFESDEKGNRTAPLRLASALRRPPFNVLFLTEEELILLYAQLAGLRATGSAEERRRLWDKVRLSVAAVPVNQARIDGALRALGKAGKNYESKERRAVLRSVLEALYRNRSCRVTYARPDGHESTYRIQPYELVEHDGGLYLYSWVPARKNAIVQAVERVRAIQPNDDEFRRETAVQERIAAMQRNAFGIFDDGQLLDVKLKFSRAVAFYVEERTWHPSQKLKRHKDGSLTLNFRASGRIEIERWIRGWGEECEVLSILQQPIKGSTDHSRQSRR
jgi:predicted DNA-binding transcriptional regulator YafY